jgi:hypothetical protein
MDLVGSDKQILKALPQPEVMGHAPESEAAPSPEAQPIFSAEVSPIPLVLDESQMEIATKHIRLYRNEVEPRHYVPVKCNYKGIPRDVHPEVCQWHRDEQDENCKGCEHY